MEDKTEVHSRYHVMSGKVLVQQNLVAKNYHVCCVVDYH